VSKEALAEHLKKPHLKPLMDKLDELLAKPVDIRHLEMLSSRAQ
jgi:quinol monooxygenase YgiN